MIHYRFELEPGHALSFDVDEDSDTSVEAPGEAYPEWMRLGFCQCPGCAVPAGSRITCPAALALRPVVEGIGPRASYEKVTVSATLGDVRLAAEVPVQKAIRSVVGLQLGLCACPVMRKLRPMARVHLPFGRRRHTIFRFVGMYLIAQHLRRQRSLKADRGLRGLLDLFAAIHEVNKHLAERIRAACDLDATVNGLVLLDIFAMEVEADVEEQLEELSGLFATWLEEDGG